MADLLLLNASNYPRRPIFPYAFVQLSSLARSHSLSCATFDFLGTPAERWEHEARRLLTEHQPRVIGIHLRQGDSMSFAPYAAGVEGFFPVPDTRRLIELVRKHTDVPIAVGGIGYTINTEGLWDYLQPDVGVTGCADPFFAHFETLASRQSLAGLPNLTYRKDGVTIHNERVLFGPATVPEYDADLVSALRNFYAARGIDSSDAGVAPVEVMRGCPFRCYFCAEPAGKGNRVRYRDLDVVFADVERLIASGFRKIWCICSELNIEGSGFALRLAERFMALNERRSSDDKVTWIAYALPKFSRDEMDLLQRSSFNWHFNDAQSLDDDNLKATRVPYRARHVLRTIKDARDLQYRSVGKTFNVFLGNAFASPTTIRRTLEQLDEAGLIRTFEESGIVPAVRVYPFSMPLFEGTQLTTISPSPELPAGDRLIWPTFKLADELLQELESPRQVLDFFRYLENNFLVRRYMRGQDWLSFLANTVEVDTLRSFVRRGCKSKEIDWSGVEPNVRERVERAIDAESRETFTASLFGEKSATANVAASTLAGLVAQAHKDELDGVLHRSGLTALDSTRRQPHRAYRLLESLVPYADVATIMHHARIACSLPQEDVGLFCLSRVLFQENVAQGLGYRKLLFAP